MTESSSFHLHAFLPSMHDVVRCDQLLGDLSLMWRMIESSAKLNCQQESAGVLPMIGTVRDGFEHLKRDLVESLVREKVATVHAEIANQAQFVIDLVVRNLYERTADVGFLAVDDVLCRFMAGHFSDEAAVRSRLHAYRAKYTVYDEIILLDLAGNVLSHLDERSELTCSTDPLIAATLASTSFVETFRASDLRPGANKALIYSRRMLDPDTGAPVGVLCLCFNFEQEMAGIFGTYRDANDRANLLLIDAAGIVIASADPTWIAVGSWVPVNLDGRRQAMMYGGRRYLVHTAGNAGYQGYPGPVGWQGQAMVPLDIAFDNHGKQALSLESELTTGILSHADTFCPPLNDILSAKATIGRVVWNGQVMTAGQQGDSAKLRALLDQISETGRRCDKLLSRSIDDLYQTALGTRLRDGADMARLMADLMERNLYERANDCRWWAMAPALGRALSEDERDWESVAGMNSMLDYINGLYTVYTRLVVYDAQGQIVAASREPASQGLIGRMIEGEVLDQVRTMQGDQDYAVTPFCASWLYEGAPTYVYHAAIRDPANGRRLVGGIGIVFDATVELAAILATAIGDRPGAMAYLLDREGHVISSNDPGYPIGSTLELAPYALDLINGTGDARVVVHGGQYGVWAVSAAAGYREFKRTDGYRADILAVVFVPIGAVRPDAGNASRRHGVLSMSDAGADGKEFATFFVDSTVFAVPAELVSHAIPAQRMTPLSIGGRSERTGVVPLSDGDAPMTFAWVFDLGYLLRGEPTLVGNDGQVIVIRHRGKSIGLLVGGLHSVSHFNPAHIVPTPIQPTRNGMLVPEVIKASGGELLIQVLDCAYLFSMLFNADIAPPATMPAERLMLEEEAQV
jgi:chemotaxis signal transduction protein